MAGTGSTLVRDLGLMAVALIAGWGLRGKFAPAHAAHEHSHDHDHDHSHLDEMELRVRALETLLTRKGYVDTAALDRAEADRVGRRRGLRHSRQGQRRPQTRPSAGGLLVGRARGIRHGSDWLGRSNRRRGLGDTP